MAVFELLTVTFEIWLWAAANAVCWLFEFRMLGFQQFTIQLDLLLGHGRSYAATFDFRSRAVLNLGECFVELSFPWHDIASSWLSISAWRGFEFVPRCARGLVLGLLKFFAVSLQFRFGP